MHACMPGLRSNAFANAYAAFALAFDCLVVDVFALEFVFDSSAIASSLLYLCL